MSGPPVLAGLLVSVLLGCSSAATRPRPAPSPSRASSEAAKPAATIVDDARSALLSATSVHISGTFTTVGESAAASSTQRLDLRLTRVNGEPAATGTVTTVTRDGAKSQTVTLSLIRLGTHLYIRGDRAYYARIGPKAVAVAGRWLVFPTSQDMSVANLTDVSALAAGFSATKGGRVEGTRSLGSSTAVVVTAGIGATLFVAATGPSRPLRLQRAGTAPEGVTGTLDFTDYDVPLTVAAPAGAIDIARLR